MGEENINRDQFRRAEIRAIIRLGSLNYRLPHISEAWGQAYKHVYGAYTEQEWINKHLDVLALIGFQRSQLAWELAKDFADFNHISGQVADMNPFGEPLKNPFYLYGINKRHRVIRHPKRYEVLCSHFHSENFDADFMEYANKVSC